MSSNLDREKKRVDALLNEVLLEFKEINTEYLFDMIESMKISGLLYDPRVIQALQNIRVEDFITFNMIETFLKPGKIKLKDINKTLLREILAQLFLVFYRNRPLLFYNHPQYARSTSAPHMIVIMAQLLDAEENDKILILGSKSGYLESIIQDMEKGIELYIIEKIPEIYKITKYNIERIEAQDRIHIYNMDPLLDLEKLPIKEFDKIFITGYLDHLPEFLLNYIKIGGYILGPFGTSYQQTFLRYFRRGKEHNYIDEEDCGKVIFSPLITDYKF
ncbi:MAG: hypothetical protein ACTSU2_16130 [Promethearchaeota archaeon]